MGSSSGTFSGSSALQNSGCEEDLKKVMDQRKRKRMISNRDSARRSRMRKQQHLEELMNQMDQLRKENNQIITTMNVTTHHYLHVEAENSVLRAQETELKQRLQALNDIINFLNATDGGFSTMAEEASCYVEEPFILDPLMINYWNNLCANQLPLMASADLLQY